MEEVNSGRCLQTGATQFFRADSSNSARSPTTERECKFMCGKDAGTNKCLAIAWWAKRRRCTVLAATGADKLEGACLNKGWSNIITDCMTRTSLNPAENPEEMIARCYMPMTTRTTTAPYFPSPPRMRFAYANWCVGPGKSRYAYQFTNQQVFQGKKGRYGTSISEDIRESDCASACGADTGTSKCRAAEWDNEQRLCNIYSEVETMPQQIQDKGWTSKRVGGDTKGEAPWYGPITVNEWGRFNGGPWQWGRLDPHCLLPYP